MTSSYEAIEVPAPALRLDPVSNADKAEPDAPDLPPAGSYGASDIRAIRLGLYAVELRKWGQGLVSAIEARERAAAIIIAEQEDARAKALARLKVLQAGE